MRLIQHNCHRKGTVVQAVLETGVARRAEVVLIQEPPVEEREKAKKRKKAREWKNEGEKEGEKEVYRLSHPGYEIYRGKRAWTAVRRDCVRNPKWRVERRTDLEEGGEGDVVVLDVTPPGCERLRIINVYDQIARRRPNYQRPARQLNWSNVIAPRTLLAGDFNAHSPVWNPRCRESTDASFLEQMIEKHDLVVWNDDRATFHREGCDNHSIIDLTITTPDLPLSEWTLEEDVDATGSDHRMILFTLTLLEQDAHQQATSQVITGWKISEMSEDEHSAAEKEWKTRAMGRPLVTSQWPVTPETIEAEALWLSETAYAVLNAHAKPKRVCARSKRWWSTEIGEKRRILGSLKRMRRRGRASAQEVKIARKELRRVIRKAKRECWQHFLQEAQGEQVWQALRYTSPQTDSTTQALRGEDGEVAATIAEKEEIIIRSAFPTPPADEPVEIPTGGSLAEVSDEEIKRAVWGASDSPLNSITNIVSAKQERQKHVCALLLGSLVLHRPTLDVSRLPQSKLWLFMARSSGGTVSKDARRIFKNWSIARLEPSQALSHPLHLVLWLKSPDCARQNLCSITENDALDYGCSTPPIEGPMERQSSTRPAKWSGRAHLCWPNRAFQLAIPAGSSQATTA
jgi:endonuclease/exonuclease/phosphatase family metal-dependent hydrolase